MDMFSLRLQVYRWFAALSHESSKEPSTEERKLVRLISFNARARVRTNFFYEDQEEEEEEKERASRVVAVQQRRLL